MYIKYFTYSKTNVVRQMTLSDADGKLPDRLDYKFVFYSHFILSLCLLFVLLKRIISHENDGIDICTRFDRISFSCIPRPK